MNIKIFVDKKLRRKKNGMNSMLLRENVFKNNFPNEYNYIMKKTNIYKDISLSERIYLLYHKIEKPKIKSKYEYFEKGYRIYRIKKEKPKKKEKIIRTKIESFLIRNKRRNSHLWTLDKIENVDYIVCPITGTRLSTLSKLYIEKTLCIPYAKFLEMYPNQKLTCDKRYENIKNGLKKIDPETGLTLYEKAHRKAVKTLKQEDENGLSGYDKIGIKTRQTHMNKIDENGCNGYNRIAVVARPKQISTLIKQGKITNSKNFELWELYKKYVWFLTSRRKKHIKCSFKLGRTIGTYQLDHKYSICSGFNNYVSPFVLSSTFNLEYIGYKDNMRKGSDCSIELKNLLEICNKSKKQSKKEFEIVMSVAKMFIKENKPASFIEFNNEVLHRLQ
ncbi:MAG: hypothetical protein WC346_12550 [Methanogenium sp.]|jgi:hypothetical protein